MSEPNLVPSLLLKRLLNDRLIQNTTIKNTKMITDNTAPPTTPPITTFRSDESSSSSNKIVTVCMNLTCCQPSVITINHSPTSIVYTKFYYSYVHKPPIHHTELYEHHITIAQACINTCICTHTILHIYLHAYIFIK